MFARYGENKMGADVHLCICSHLFLLIHILKRNRCGFDCTLAVATFVTVLAAGGYLLPKAFGQLAVFDYIRIKQTAVAWL